MPKDRRLSQQAATDVGATTPTGAKAAELYEPLAADGQGDRDFSAIIGLLRGAMQAGS